MESGRTNMDLKGNSYQWVKTNNPNIYKLKTNLSTQNCKIRRDIESDDIEMIELNQGLKFTNISRILLRLIVVILKFPNIQFRMHSGNISIIGCNLFRCASRITLTLGLSECGIRNFKWAP